MSEFTHDTVAAMLAPALFLTATGSLLISTANRIGRIVDRIRAIVTLCENGQLERLDFSEQRRERSMEELRHLHWRRNRAAVAVTMLYMAFCAFAMTSMMIAIDSIAGHHLKAMPVLCAVGGVGLLIVACVHLVLEARSSLQASDREVRFLHEIESLRDKAKETNASPPGTAPNDAATTSVVPISLS
jgi:Protein of unknown function (DUF2721)